MYQDPDEFALLAAQAGVHFADRLAPGPAAFQTADVVEIHGPLDEELFGAALTRVVREAETLRTVVREHAGGPRQRVAPAPADAPLHRLDLRADPAPLAAARAWTHADLTHPCTAPTPTAGPADHAAGAPGASGAPTAPEGGGADAAPLMTQALIRLADDHYWWYQRAHHIAADSHALHLVGRRTAEVYTALATGQEPPRTRFAPLREVVEEESRYLNGERYAADREFWTERLAGTEVPTTLGGPPTGRPATVLRGHTDLPPGTFHQLTEAAATSRATWAELVLAATALHLHRGTGARNVVLGLALANRRGPAALHTPATGENVVPLRLDVHPADTGAELLRRVALEVRAVRRHQRYPQSDLRQDLGRTGADRPLTGPVISIKPVGAALDFASSPGTVHHLATGPVEDLTIGVAPGVDGGLRLSFDAHAGRYDEPAATRHRATLGHLLTAYADLLLTDPQRPVGTLDLLPRDEVWAATRGRAEAPARRTLPAALTDRVARTPDAVAVRAVDATLTFAELESAASGLGAELARLGVTTGTPVALALPRTSTMVVALFAVLGAGGVCQPLDLEHPAARTRAVLADARPVCVLGTTGTLAALPDQGLPVLALDDPATRDLLARHLAAVPSTRPTPRDPAYLVHPHHSHHPSHPGHGPDPFDGRAEGVLVSHAALANRYEGHGTDHIAPAVARTGRARLRLVHSASFASDAAWDPLLWMVHGHELHLLDEATRRDPTAFTAYVHRERIDHLAVTPSQAAALLAEGLLDEGHHQPAVLTIEGEPAPEPLRQHVPSAAGLYTVHQYGPTGAHGAAYSWRVGEPGDPRGPVVGRPVRGSRAYVLDAALRPVPPGATGELYLAGPCLAVGYLGRPDRTAQRFVADPFGALHDHPGSRMYRTGDLARRRADGTVELLAPTVPEAPVTPEAADVLGAPVGRGDRRAPVRPVPARDAGLRRRVLGADDPRTGAAPRPAPVGCTLPEVYGAVARRYPDRIAVSHGGATLSHARLCARAHQVARMLAVRGIGPGSVVALALPRSTDLVTGLLAVTLAGAAYLPLDLDHPAGRLSCALADVAPAAVVTDSVTVPRLPDHDLPILCTDSSFVDRYATRPLTQAERTRPLTPYDPVCVIHAPDAADGPEGVTVTHHDVTRLLTATDRGFGFRPDDAWTRFPSHAFDSSVWELWGALLHGGRVVVDAAVAVRADVAGARRDTTPSEPFAPLARVLSERLTEREK
ncbi:AMP-binding protein [Streptomyces sp. NPDC005955]|uniref:AMP-binding protein n=1 Tax=Streptomyces sp. NPDC005955 TaxID=3364738 RepID=UPI003697BD11